MKKEKFEKKIKELTKNLSIIDFFFIIFLIAVGFGFFLFFFRKSEFVTIRIKVTNQEILYADKNPKNWYASRFEVGDAEKDTLGRPITEIINIESFALDEKEYAVFLDLNVKATYDSRTETYSFRGKTLSFGTPVRFNLSKITFDGIVTEFPGSEREIQNGDVMVTLLLRNVEPALASAITQGDIVSDSNGKSLVEVVETEITAAEKVVNTDRGDLLLRRDPLYKDLMLKAKVAVRTDKNDKVIAFDDYELKIGSVMPLNFSKVSLFPMITEIEKID